VLSVLGPIRVEHRTHCTGRRVFPVLASGVAYLHQRVFLLGDAQGASCGVSLVCRLFATLSVHESGEHRIESGEVARLQTSLRMRLGGFKIPTTAKYSCLLD